MHDMIGRLATMKFGYRLAIVVGRAESRVLSSYFFGVCLAF